MKKYKLGFYMGRFQHIHIGHESIIAQGLEKCEKLLVLVGSSQLSQTIRNPFSVILRRELIKSIFRNSENVFVGAIKDLTHEDDHSTDWGRFVLKNVDDWSRFYEFQHKPDAMIYGNDEERSSWFDPNDVVGIEQIVLPRNLINISATELRNMIAENNYDDWCKYTNPLIYSRFTDLREQLLRVDYYNTSK